MNALKNLISPIGFGAFKIGANQGIKYDQSYDLPDGVTAERLLNGVLDLGVTYVDTAPAYGLSEERIGKFISHRRAEYILSTKVGERYENGESTYDFSEPGIRKSIEQSLCRLRTDVLDIVFIHAPRADLSAITDSDAVSTLIALRERGLIRAIGFSGYTLAAYRRAFEWAEALMLEYHSDHRTLELVIQEASEGGKIVVVKKGLASGRMAGEQAVRFALANPGVTSLVIGSLSLQHMTENVDVAQEVRGWQPPRKKSTAPSG